jgi:hypothetical protein
MACEYRAGLAGRLIGVAFVMKGVIVLRRLLVNLQGMPAGPGCFMR